MREPEETDWRSRALKNLLNIPSDAWGMIKGFVAAQGALLPETFGGNIFWPR